MYSSPEDRNHEIEFGATLSPRCETSGTKTLDGAAASPATGDHSDYFKVYFDPDPGFVGRASCVSVAGHGLLGTVPEWEASSWHPEPPSATP